MEFFKKILKFLLTSEYKIKIKKIQKTKPRKLSKGQMFFKNYWQHITDKQFYEIDSRYLQKTDYSFGGGG